MIAEPGISNWNHATDERQDGMSVDTPTLGLSRSFVRYCPKTGLALG